MQRLSNVILYVVLLVFVVAVSLALIAAAWLMTAHLLNGSVRPSLAKWLFISLTVMSLKEASAQKTAAGAFMMIEERIVQANGQTTVSYGIATYQDTLPPLIRTSLPDRKHRISPKPVWPMVGSSVIDEPSESDPSSIFYIMAAEPNPSACRTGYWFRSHP